MESLRLPLTNWLYKCMPAEGIWPDDTSPRNASSHIHVVQDDSPLLSPGFLLKRAIKLGEALPFFWGNLPQRLELIDILNDHTECREFQILAYTEISKPVLIKNNTPASQEILPILENLSFHSCDFLHTFIHSFTHSSDKHFKSTFNSPDILPPTTERKE